MEIQDEINTALHFIEHISNNVSPVSSTDALNAISDTEDTAMEIWDLYDEHENKTGETWDRKNAISIRMDLASVAVLCIHHCD